MRCRTLVLSVVVLLVSGAAVAAGYRTTVGAEPDAIAVVVVSGSPYEMGYAQGVLLKPAITAVLPNFLQRARARDPERFSDENLAKAWDHVSPYVSERFVEEMRGLAEGSGVEYDRVLRAHMIPVVANYSCSGVAVWGDATRDGHLYQIRNLDYSMGGGLQDYPAVVVYVPEDGVAHLNVGFTGVIGSNTGMNAEGIALTEIGDSPGRDYPFDLDGVPFMMLFRDILYDARSLDDAVRMIKQAKRIKKYHYVVGDGQTPAAVKMKAHAPDLDIWTDHDPDDELAPKVLKNIVYHAEGRDPIAYAHLSRYQRETYAADSMIQLSKAIGSLGGNLMNVVYDATALEIWVAYAHKKECAYRRPYVHINMNDYIPYNPDADNLNIEAKVE